MRQNIQGIPSTIEVDGKTYIVRYYQGFKVDINAKTRVSVAKFSELAGRIQAEEAHLAETRKYERQERAAKRAESKKVPLVLARLRGSNERVEVRGKSSKGRWNDNYLITRADGSKDTVSGYGLISLSSDAGVLSQIAAEEKALQAEVKVVSALGDLTNTLNILRQATVDITFDNDVFTGTFDGLTAQGSGPRAVEDEIVKLVVARERPWSVETNDGVTSVISTQESTKSRFASYHEAWVDKADAERYAGLQNQLVDLGKKRALASEKFDYEAEVAAARANV